jgi:hypothetical protein
MSWASILARAPQSRPETVTPPSVPKTREESTQKASFLKILTGNPAAAGGGAAGAAAFRGKIRQKPTHVSRSLSPLARKIYLLEASPEKKQGFSLLGKSILEIRFSQDTIAECTKEGTTVHALARKMSKYSAFTEAPLDVVIMPDRKITSLDNRRLSAAKDAFNALTLKVNLIHHRKMAPEGFIRSLKGQLKRNHGIEDIEPPQHIRVGTYGHCIILRMAIGEGDIDREPYGFSELPYIR